MVLRKGWLPATFFVLALVLRPALAVAASGSDGSRTGFTVPFELNGGAIIVEGRINDGAGQYFVLEPSRGNAFTPEAAQKSGLLDAQQDSSANWTELVGPSAKPVVVRTRQVKTLTIGSAILVDQRFAIRDLPNGAIDRGAKPRLAGSIGEEIFRHYVIRFDFETLTMHLTPADQFKHQGRGIVLPLFVPPAAASADRPQTVPTLVDMSLDGVLGLFYLQMNTRGRPMLLPNYAKRLVAGGGREKQLSAPFQVEFAGQLSEETLILTRAGGASLGPIQVDRPIFSYIQSDEKYRQLATSSAGSISLGILQPSAVTVDYPGERLIVEIKSTRFADRPVRGTGFQFDKPDRMTFQVVSVIPGTPAERSGLKRDDRIATVNGTPAIQLGLGDLQSLEMSPRQNKLDIETIDGRAISLPIVDILP